MKRAVSMVMILALLLCLLPSCARNVPAEAVSRTIFAMDTVMDLSVCGDEALLDGAEALIMTLEGELSVTDEGSDIYALNRDGAAELSPDAAELLTLALDLCRRTGGALDITVYPIVRLWGFTTGDYRVPAADEIAALLPGVDCTAVSWDAASRTAAIPEGAAVDLGSVAKGYASDRIISLWRGAGVTSALINLGGNVMALGAKPDGSPWRVAIKSPDGTDIAGVVEVEDKAVITSGGYERYFEEDGVTYWHIMDPETGAPARSDLISVSIIGESGVTCDALSTALFVMGLDDAADFWRESSDFEAVFITTDGRLLVTEGVSESFTPYGAYAGTEVEVIRRG